MAEMRLREIPENIKRLFKVTCAEEDVSMNDKMIELMTAYLKRKGRLD